jgi:diguanylate cyclase (GGDEF)-like protein
MNALVAQQLARLQDEKLSLSTIVEPCETVSPERPALEVLDLFLARRDLRVLPVVSARRPVGLVNRHMMVEMFSRPFRRDLYGRRPIRNFMDARPIVVDISTDIDDLAQTLISAGLQQMLDGFLIVDAEGEYSGIGNAQDLLSEITKRKQSHLYQLAHFDPLTNLPNRILFRDRLKMAIEQAARGDQQLAVLFIDIDHFKRINDTLGHPAGDELLRAVARRLFKSVRGCDTLARMGGDEFTLVLTELSSAADAATAVRKLRERLRGPVVVSGHETVVTASIGIAIYPQDATAMDELVRKADIALYAAKHAGRDTYSFFDKSHEVFDDARLFLEQELRTAIAEHRITPVFQGQVDAYTGEPVGAEALARWRHPDKGMIPPATFVPLAEDRGLIKPLGQSVLRSAALAIAQTPAMRGLRLSVNVSALEIREPDYVDNLDAVLHEADLDPAAIQLEITERLFIEPNPEILQRLERLRGLGVTIAIDDFGIGSTSLSLLHKLPVDVLKIDRSFIEGFCNDRRADALVRAIIDMGHALDMQIVAEGVENAEQATRLREYGCDFLQGYLFSEPLAQADFADWLASQPG